MKLVAKVRAALADAAQPARAEKMQAYMKSAMPYLGVPMPEVRRICRSLFADYPFEDADRWRADVLAVWRGARFREERYAAIALLRHGKAKRFRTIDSLPLYEELIVTGAWWDLVDEIATHPLGELLAAHPREMKKVFLAWSRSPDLWKRRASIIGQMFHGKATDTELLYECMEPSLSSKEFFLRKAIGWALRQLAKHDPDEVVRYVAEHEAELSGLSKREALKHVAPRRRAG